MEYISNEPSLAKEQAMKEFKKTYGGGYLGYHHIHDLGDIYFFINSDDRLEFYTKKLEPKIS